MREFVGVKPANDFSRQPSLKREALIFDRVAFTDYSACEEFIKLSSDGLTSEAIREFNWLIEVGIAFEVSSPESFSSIYDSEDFDRYLDILDSTLPLADGKPRPHPEVELVQENFARLCAIELRLINGLEAYPVSSKLVSLEEIKASKNDVVQIVLNGIPIPQESTRWEQIVEYRSDPDSQSKFLALRHWMSEVARAEIPPAEVEEKLEYLIDQYQRHMKLHRMKTNVGTLETVVTTGAEFLGDLVSFKWGKAAEALFSLRRRRVALLEGELTAPGNEVAYIVKARETFGG